MRNLFIILSLTLTSLNYSIALKTNNTSYIKECCTTTTYPHLCYATLSTYASQIRTSPRLLSTKSLSVALAATQSASRTMARLMRLRGLRPKEEAALSECSMGLGHSEAQLQRSVEEMGRQGMSEMMASDVETWTSAALTYEETCMEEFEGREMKGNVKIIVRRNMWKVIQLTSNALALLHHVLLIN